MFLFLAIAVVFFLLGIFAALVYGFILNERERQKMHSPHELKNVLTLTPAPPKSENNK